MAGKGAGAKARYAGDELVDEKVSGASTSGQHNLSLLALSCNASDEVLSL